MTLNLSSYQLAQYQSQLFTRPVAAAQIDNIPQICPTSFDWSAYPSRAITLNFQQQGGPLANFTSLLSVYIDNLGVNSPIAVVFPDTGQEVTCPPNSTKSARVMSSAATANVYLLSARTTGNTGLTKVFFANFPQMPDLDDTSFQSLILGQASNASADTLTVGGKFALGDMQQQHVLDMTTASPTHAFVTSDLANPTKGTIIVTDIDIETAAYFNVGSPMQGIVAFQYGVGTSYNPSLTLFTQPIVAPNDLSKHGPFKLLSLSGLQWRWPAVNVGGIGVPYICVAIFHTVGGALSTAIKPSSGTLSFNVGYTYSEE